MRSTLHPALALAASAAVASGLALTSLPAEAAATHSAPNGRVSPRSISAARLAQVRERQRQLIAQRRPAPTLGAASAGKVARILVTTTEDSGLVDPTGTACVDAATGGCSLRAAVDAANNRATAVRIVLARATYTLSTGTDLLVTNPGGTSVVGVGSGRTVVRGAGSRVFEVTKSDPNDPAPLLYLTDLGVTGGSTIENGGGIFVGNGAPDATLVLDGVKVSDNSTLSSGGGIFVDNYANVYASHTTITGNTAVDGGGLYTSFANTSFTDVDITGNHAPTGSAGGWDNTIGVVTMTGGSISGNDAASEAGGLYDYLGNLSFTGVAIDGNTATTDGFGGAVYAENDSIQMNGGSMSHNRALGGGALGGGAYLIGGSSVELHGVAMIGNRLNALPTDAAAGGAVYVAGSGDGMQLTIDQGSRIKGSNGSAVYVTTGPADVQIDDTRLVNNTDAYANGFNSLGCGGAVCAVPGNLSSVNLTISNDTFTQNSSTGDHGAGGITVWATQHSGARVHLLHSVFSGNTAGAGGLGGAVGVFSDADSSPVSIRSQANTFTGNEAGTSADAGNGGAIGIEGNAAFVDRSSTYTQNRSRGPESWGGAVYDKGQQSSQFVGSTFTKNAASPAGIGHGGAVFTDDEQGTVFTRVNVVRNRSGEYGGGLDSSFEGYDVSVVASTLSGNVAGNKSFSGAGGGIYVDDGVLAIENSTVTGNRVVQSTNPDDGAIGGGIYSGGSTFGLRYSTVTGNVAPEGGGYYLDTKGGAVLGSIVTANHQASGAEQDCTAFDAAARPRSLGGNVLGQPRCVTGVQGNDTVTRHPGLLPLARNGGPS